MPLLSASERSRALALTSLAYANPFLPDRIAGERAVLGSRYVEGPPWNLGPGREVVDPNIAAIREGAETLADRIRDRLVAPAGRPKATEEDLALYEGLVLFLMYYRYNRAFEAFIGEARRGGGTSPRVDFFEGLKDDAAHYLGLPGFGFAALEELPHVFACYYQIRRAFHHIFYYIVGTSPPVARLRASVWQSIFSHDIRRYRKSLFRRMADYTTLITGPSGTGKELVARAIGFARYIPFDSRARAFKEDFFGSFHELNLAALAPTLIESELFGHRRGAFTGAVSDRKGWLETSPPLGTLFLDEIGDLEASIQVKLVRVVQTRSFQRLGETRPRRFEGKIIAATHRDLEEAMRKGRFREDLYYRLCSDVVEVPSLQSRLRADPGELRRLIDFIVDRELGDEGEAVAEEVESWIDGHLGAGYAWPGNVRELEQCVRNVLIRKEYRPRAAAARDPREELAAAVARGTLTAAELMRRYTTLVHAETGNYEETARRLGVDRRTVKSKVDHDLLERLGPRIESS